MLSYLGYREIGFHAPHQLQNAEQLRRTYSLQLSKTSELYSSHQGAVTCLDIDGNEGRYLLSGGADAALCIFDIEEPVKSTKNKTEMHQIAPLASIPKNRGHEFAVSCVQWYTVDNGLFFSGSFDKTVRVWDPNEMKEVRRWTLEGKVYCMNLAPNARSHSLIAVGTGDPKGRLLDLRSGTSTHILTGHREAIWSIKWNPSDEYLLATGSVDRTIRFWDIRKAGYLMVLDQLYTPESAMQNKKFTINLSKTSSALSHNGSISALSFTPDGQFLLSTGLDSKLRCWNTTTGMNTMVNYSGIKNNSRHGNQMAVSFNGAVVFHPNLSNIHSYSIHTGQHVSTLQGHYERVSCCVFHPFLEELYSGGSDCMILKWTPPSASQEEEANEDESSDDNWSDEDLFGDKR